MKLAIALPLTDDRLHKAFFTSFTQMWKPDSWTLLLPKFAAHEADIARIRNHLAERAVIDGFDKIIFMDTDQVYPADTVQKLCSHDLDIIGAPVHRRYPPFFPIAYRGEHKRYRYVPEEEVYSGDLIELDATGTGCLMVDCNVFLGLEPPWFEIVRREDGTVDTGEDIYFCNKAKKAGYKIHMDTSIEVDHLTTYAINKDTFMMLKFIEMAKRGGTK